jgi:hypothetical protein
MITVFNWNVCRRQWSWRNPGTIPTFWERVRKITTNFSQNSQYSSLDSNRTPPEYNFRELKLYQPGRIIRRKISSPSKRLSDFQGLCSMVTVNYFVLKEYFSRKSKFPSRTFCDIKFSKMTWFFQLLIQYKTSKQSFIKSLDFVPLFIGFRS